MKYTKCQKPERQHKHTQKGTCVFVFDWVSVLVGGRDRDGGSVGREHEQPRERKERLRERKTLREREKHPS